MYYGVDTDLGVSWVWPIQKRLLTPFPPHLLRGDVASVLRAFQSTCLEVFDAYDVGFSGTDEPKHCFSH